MNLSSVKKAKYLRMFMFSCDNIFINQYNIIIKVALLVVS